MATTTELVAARRRAIKEGDALTATVTVRAADGYEVGGRVRFSAPGWEQTVYLEHGVASVTRAGRHSRAGVETVKAEYLGHDVLTASQEAEPATVLRTRTPVDAPVGGTVPATLSLTLGASGVLRGVHARAWRRTTRRRPPRR